MLQISIRISRGGNGKHSPEHPLTAWGLDDGNSFFDQQTLIERLGRFTRSSSEPGAINRTKINAQSLFQGSQDQPGITWSKTSKTAS